MKFSYHKNCIGKPVKKFDEAEKRWNLWCGNKKINLGYGWVTVDLEFENIFDLLTIDGCAIAPALTNDHRIEENFLSHELALVDIDGGMTLEELQEHPFYKLYGSGYYTTSSHTDTDPRFRIIYRLPEPITDPEHMRMIYEGLMALHGSADVSCRDSARLFYGTVNAKHRELTGRFVDIFGLEIILEAYDFIMQEKKLIYQSTNNTNKEHEPASLQDVEQILDELRRHYSDLEYSRRRDVTWAVLSAVDKNNAISLMRARWPDADKTMKYEGFVNDHKRVAIRLGTVIVMIRKHNPNYGKRLVLQNNNII